MLPVHTSTAALITQYYNWTTTTWLVLLHILTEPWAFALQIFHEYNSTIICTIIEWYFPLYTEDFITLGTISFVQQTQQHTQCLRHCICSISNWMNECLPVCLLPCPGDPLATRIDSYFSILSASHVVSAWRMLVGWISQYKYSGITSCQRPSFIYARVFANQTFSVTSIQGCHQLPQHPHTSPDPHWGGYYLQGHQQWWLVTSICLTSGSQLDTLNA